MLVWSFYKPLTTKQDLILRHFCELIVTNNLYRHVMRYSANKKSLNIDGFKFEVQPPVLMPYSASSCQRIPQAVI